MLVTSGILLGFVGIVLLIALLMNGIEAGSEMVRDLKHDHGLKIALWVIAGMVGLLALGPLTRFVYWLLG